MSNLKKTIIICEAILLFSFFGCTFLKDTTTSQKEEALEAATKLMHFFENGDVDSLTVVLSEDALNTADLSTGIDYTFELFSGSIQSVNSKAVTIGKSWDNGFHKAIAEGYYIVITEEETYKLYIEYILEDTQNPENIGKFQKIKVARQVDIDALGDSYIPGKSYSRLGIYNPEWDEWDQEPVNSTTTE